MSEDYAQNLEANLLDLLERIKSGRYQAPRWCRDGVRGLRAHRQRDEDRRGAFDDARCDG
jgi:hypothetical protein